jgi:hypothetical protein
MRQSGLDPSAGGKARAKKLTKSQREEIARRAADARWNIPTATHSGVIRIAGHEVACAVLEDGRRVINQQSFSEAIGRKGKPKVSQRKADGGFFDVPAFVAADNLKPYIGSDLTESSTPIVYRPEHAGRAAYGYEARLLPLVCDVYVAADAAGALHPTQKPSANTCRVLLKAFSQLGIVALVDEATGYQEVRDKMALQAILDCYLLQAFAAWAKRFPDDFYKEMFRLKGWTWKNLNPANGPRCIAQYTKDIVYARLEAGLLRELESRNPVQSNGRRKTAHHQWLTDDLGHPKLSNHVHAVTALMRATADGQWDSFKRMLDRAFPPKGHSIQLDFDDLPVVAGLNANGG